MSLQSLDATAEETLERAVAIRGRSLWIDARARLFKNRAAVVSMVILAIITLMAIFAPLLSPYPFDKVNFNLVSCSPDWWPDKMVLCNAGGRALVRDRCARAAISSCACFTAPAFRLRSGWLRRLSAS